MWGRCWVPWGNVLGTIGEMCCVPCEGEAGYYVGKVLDIMCVGVLGTMGKCVGYHVGRCLVPWLGRKVLGTR